MSFDGVLTAEAFEDVKALRAHLIDAVGSS
jgi:hypothetical protein